MPTTTEAREALTDRELLELAARAIDREIVGWGPVMGCDGEVAQLASEVFTGAYNEWNPLTDDGDALRLLNKLRLQLRHVHGQAHAGEPDCFWCTENWFPDGDPDAATRRAIVRAAAALAQSEATPPLVGRDAAHTASGLYTQALQPDGSK